MALQGSCYCGAVTFRVETALTGVISCHCRDCQRINGNVNALVLTDKSGVTIEGQDCVQWFETSPGIRRSFCATCGTRLFKDKGTDKLIISAGIFEPPLQRTNAINLFVESAPDWHIVAHTTES